MMIYNLDDTSTMKSPLLVELDLHLLIEDSDEEFHNQ